MRCLVTIFSLRRQNSNFGASAGGKAAEKVSVTYHFPISAMQAFVCGEFHVLLSHNIVAVTS